MNHYQSIALVGAISRLFVWRKVSKFLKGAKGSIRMRTQLSLRVVYCMYGTCHATDLSHFVGSKKGTSSPVFGVTSLHDEVGYTFDRLSKRIDHDTAA
jgi:hypothetical protein